MRGNQGFQRLEALEPSLEGITSFSTVPLRIWTYVGGLVSLIALAYATKVVITTIVSGPICAATLLY